MPECPPREDLRAYGLDQARQKGIPEGMYDRQITQESNWEHCRADGSLKMSSGNAGGVAQIIARWHPTVDVADPWASLRYSTDMMAGLYRRVGSWRYALAAYNWGPSNVAGYTKPDGTVVPPWDGRRETISDQGRHYLDVILGSAWEEPDGSIPAPAPSSILYEEYRDPGHPQFAKMPKGVVLHGSRSGSTSNTLDQEYRGTANWELNNPNGYAWHATIGDKKVAVHLTPREWGQHDPWASQEYMGVEFAQPTVNHAITDGQVEAFADWFKDRVLSVWPSIPRHFPSHAEVDREYGQNQGKTDAFPIGDPRMDDLRGRIMARLQVAPELPPAPANLPVLFDVGPGIAARMAEMGDEPASGEFYPNPHWSEAIGRSGRRYVYVRSTNTVHVYAPAA